LIDIKKTSLITAILLISSCTPLIAAHDGADEFQSIVDYVTEHLSINQDTVLIYVWGPVDQGTEVTTSKDYIMTTPEQGHVVYIDLHPTANLFHPVQYLFLSATTQEIASFDAMSPPENWDDYHFIETEIGRHLQSARNRRAPIPQNNKPTTAPIGSDTRYAVLMNGGHSSGSNHVRYWNDLSNIYITLVYTYEFPDENIIVLCSDGLDPSPDQSNGLNSDPDLDGDGDDDIMYSCILSNVDLVFAELANTLTARDKLFVFATDHGSSQGGWDTIFNLWNAEELTDDHFKALLDNLPPCEIICTFEPCYSGGFLDDIVVSPGPIVASSACRYDELSWAMPPDYVYDEYVFHWTAAVKGEDAYGNPVDADYNQDGLITMDEAYRYAEENDLASENPQYGDYPQDIGTEMTLFPSNKAPENPEKPDGPSQGIILDEYSFTTSTIEPENEPIYFLFSWDDGTTSNWLGPYASNETVQSSHSWNEAGDYNITVKAKDENGTESDWSEPHTVHITKPILDVKIISGGLFRISVPLRNGGEANATDITWTIRLEGGTIFLGKETTGTISNLPAGEVITLNTGLIFGFGKTRVYVTAEEPRGSSDHRDQGAAVLLFYINVNSGGG
jgi:hypothetical protein